MTINCLHRLVVLAVLPVVVLYASSTVAFADSLNTSVGQDLGKIVAAAEIRFPSGGTVQLKSGTYLQSGCIWISKPNLKILGDADGKTIVRAIDPANQCIVLNGPGQRLERLHLTAEISKQRLRGVNASRVVLKGSNQSVEGLVIEDSAAAGIFIQGGKHYLVQGNKVYRSLADGIHSAEGAINGVIKSNSVINPGDDGISVVSYANNPMSSNIEIIGNNIEDGYNARGISVVGGENILIRDNQIKNIARAAAIYIAQEASYNTQYVRNVCIFKNNIYWTADSPKAKNPTHQAAIDLDALHTSVASQGVAQIYVMGNQISNAPYGKIRKLGNVTNLRLQNVYDKVQAEALPAPWAWCDR